MRSLRRRDGYDLLARPYVWLERLTFGGSLMRARLRHLPTLADARRVLLVGEGDGRFLAALRRLNPRAEAVPAHGWRRRRAQLWLTLLYTAFGPLTDLRTRRLAPVGPRLEAPGLELRADDALQAGLLRSRLSLEGESTARPPPLHHP